MMKHLIPGIVLGCLLSRVQAQSPTQNTDPSEGHYREALRLLDAQGPGGADRQKRAIEELNIAIHLDPANIEANLQWMYHSRAAIDSGEAGKHYSELVERNPRSAVFHYLLGENYELLLRHHDAANEFHEALTLNPDLVPALIAASANALKSGDRTAALAYAQHASRSAGDSAEFHSDLANLFYAFRDYPGVESEAARVEAIDPAYCFPLRQGYKSVYDLKWRSLVTMAPESLATKRTIEADAHRLEKLPDPDLKRLLLIKTGYELAGDTSDSERLARELSDKSLAIQKNQPRFASLDPPALAGDADDSFQRALQIQELRPKIAAIKALEPRVHNSDDRIFVYWPTLLRLQVEAKDTRGALETIARVEQESSAPLALFEDARAHIAVARLMANSGDYPTALTHLGLANGFLKMYVRFKSASSDAAVVLASSLQSQGEYLAHEGRFPEAIDSFQQVLALRQTATAFMLRQMGPAAQVWAALGRANQAVGNKAEAFKDFTAAYCDSAERIDVEEAWQLVHPGELSEAPVNLAQEKALLQTYEKEVEAVDSLQRPAPLLAQYLQSAVQVQKRERAIEAMQASKAAPPVEDFTLPLVNGGSIRLSSLRGKIVVLNFWATWCAPCRKEYPYLQQIQSEYGNRHVAVVMVSVDEDKYLVKPFIQQHRFSATVAFSDGFIRGKFAGTSVPLTVILDRNGAARLQEEGFSGEMPETYRAVIDLLLKEKSD